jgi:hypothetical protein
VVLANFSDRAPCHRKHRRPPSAQAVAEAERVRRAQNGLTGEQVVIDFNAYVSGTRPWQRPDPINPTDGAVEGQESS